MQRVLPRLQHVYRPFTKPTDTTKPFTRIPSYRRNPLYNPSFDKMGGSSVANDVTLYSSGDAAFREMWQAIGKAKKRILMESYIIEPDTVGKATMQHLIDARKRGCEVYLLYDTIGSKHLRREHINMLVKEGIHVEDFNPMSKWPFRIHNHRGMYRDHRKLLVIDDHTGFCGGMNIGSEYAGYKVGGTKFYRDTHMKITGPAVYNLQQVFALSMIDTCRTPPSLHLRKGHTDLVTPLVIGEEVNPLKPTRQTVRYFHAGKFVQILASNPSRGIYNIQSSIIQVIEKSSKHLYITTPYFVPPPDLIQALINASNRGTDVRILTSRLSEVFGIKTASQYAYNQLLNNKVRVYEYFVGNIHAKTLTADGHYSLIGSFNLDPVSFYHNLELGVVTFDEDMARQLENDFIKDLEGSREITLKEFKRRRTWLRSLWHWFHYKLMTKVLF
ncbi:cardiolipin synthetase 2 [Planoprotostelium fungivorum]|uniref:Cardiolipin synthetase 2 n=1 Tax=Planoprotostelium fungivorum TaxID=1890364 RepID=A0A2P6NG06_9EUKA|nr:cardiolipin synthetase 2 [Planoprotostelium fungivorum]